MHVRRLERRLVRPSAARHDPHLLRLAGMDDLARALEVTVRYRVEAAAEHRDARVARRRAIVQRERLLRAGASLRQLLHRRCRHSRHHREQEAVTDGTTYMYNPRTARQHRIICSARLSTSSVPLVFARREDARVWRPHARCEDGPAAGGQGAAEHAERRGRGHGTRDPNRPDSTYQALLPRRHNDARPGPETCGGAGLGACVRAAYALRHILPRAHARAPRLQRQEHGEPAPSTQERR
jgi:hypothetical protein